MKSRILFAAGFLISIAFPAIAAPTQKMPSIDEIQKYIDEYGGKAALDRYFNCAESSPNGLGYNAIIHGGKRGVDLDFEIEKYSDGCVAENLTWALGSEMQVSPSAVLPLVESNPNATDICLPFLSADAPKSVTLADARRSRKALETVRDPALRSAKNKCLAVVDQAIEGISK